MEQKAKDGNFIGREGELGRILSCLELGRNVLIEGPVGVGKTQLALEACRRLKRQMVRVDGDQRYTEQKLTGWFDPGVVASKGFAEEAFVAGPLVQAMREGKLLFINELNRMPETVQNVLLPSLDEGLLQVPMLGTVRAVNGFNLIATQNPKEFVATTLLSEAVLDRLEWVSLGFPPAEEELRILRSGLKPTHGLGQPGGDLDTIAQQVFAVVRSSRQDPRVRRGASIRAGKSLAEITQLLLSKRSDPRSALLEACAMALSNRIEWDRETVAELGQSSPGVARSASDFAQAIFAEWVDQAIAGGTSGEVKKKT